MFLRARMHTRLEELTLIFSISLVPTVKQGERDEIERQREAKWTNKELLKKKKLLDAQNEYASALTYIEIYHSQACWISEEDVARQF